MGLMHWRRQKGGGDGKARLDTGSPGLRRRLLEAVLQNAPVAYIVLDGSYRVRFASGQLLRLRGLGPGDVLGRVCHDALNGGERCPVCVVRKAMEEGGGHRVLRRDVLPDGSVVYTDDFAAPFRLGGEDLVLEALIDRTDEMLLREKANEVFLEAIRSMIRLLERKDPYTSRHCREVSAVASKLTRHMGLGDHAVFNAMLGGLLHDLGKLHVPDAILNKGGRLEDRELDAIREHPIFSYLLLPVTASFSSIREIAASHHERWDGTGYPAGLAGEAIPIEARIAAVADTYSAMTSDRPYRKGLAHAAAVEEIKRNAGTQFDPRVVEEFVRMVEEGAMDKGALTAAEETTAFVQMLRSGRRVQRKISGAGGGRGAPGAPAGDAAEGDAAGLAASAAFADAVLGATPATFLVIDESLGILYASDGFARDRGRPAEELLAEKCFDATGAKVAHCFEVSGGAVRCPAVRAFASGRPESALIREEIAGRARFHGAHTVPMELEGADGRPVRCCLQMFFDRTAERLAQEELETDLRQIAEALYNFAAELAPDATGNLDALADEAVGFSGYLERVRGELADMLGPRGAG